MSDELVYGRPAHEWDELADACLEFLLEIARYRLTTHTELNEVLVQRTGLPGFNFVPEAISHGTKPQHRVSRVGRGQLKRPAVRGRVRAPQAVADDRDPPTTPLRRSRQRREAGPTRESCSLGQSRRAALIDQSSAVFGP